MKRNHQTQSVEKEIQKSQNPNDIVKSISRQLKFLYIFIVSLTIYFVIYVNYIGFAYAQVDSQVNFITYLTENSLTSVLLSTGLLALFGYAITKIKALKKKLDMIEVITQIQLEQKEENQKAIKEVIKKIDEVKEEVDDVKEDVTDFKKDTQIEFKEISKEQHEIKDEMMDRFVSYLSDIKKNTDKQAKRNVEYDRLVDENKKEKEEQSTNS